MSKRKISISVFFNLLSQNIINLLFFCFGILFSAVSLLSILAFSLIAISFNANFRDDYESYDASQILKKGTEAQAYITDIKVDNRVLFNGKNPLILSYEYKKDDTVISDKFKTLEIEKANELVGKGPMPIKFYEGESVIVGLEQFNPRHGLFVLMGLGCFLYGCIIIVLAGRKPFKTYSLYRNGEVREAEIDDIVSFPGNRSRVTYYYTLTNGEKAYGISSSDYYLYAEKNPGDLIKIFVDTKNENISILVPRNIITS